MCVDKFILSREKSVKKIKETSERQEKGRPAIDYINV